MTNFTDFPLSSSDVIKVVQTLYSIIAHYKDNQGKICRRDDNLYFFQLHQSKKIVFGAHVSIADKKATHLHCSKGLNC